MPDADRRSDPKTYTEDEREEALMVMALNNGSRSIAEKETGVPANTLNAWAYRHPEWRKKYREMRTKVRTQIAESRVEKLLRRAEEAGQAADIIRARMLEPENVKDIPARELPGAYRNAATAAGIYETNATKALEQLAGHSSVNINLDFNELVRSLTGRGAKLTDNEGKELDPEKVINGQAKEVKGEA